MLKQQKQIKEKKNIYIYIYMYKEKRKSINNLMESLEVNPQAQDRSKKVPVYNAMSWYLNAPKS